MLEPEVFDTRLLKDTRDTAFPEFYYKATLDAEESLKQGKQIFKDTEYVRIHTGDKTNIPDLRVEDQHRKRWANQYKAFLDKQEQRPEGFPLNAWGANPPKSLVSTLEAMKIYTVEQFANMPENLLPKGMDVMGWRAKAQTFLNARDDAAAVTKMQATMDKMSAQMEMKDDAIRRLQERLEALEKDAPKGVKRRKKGEDA